MSKLTCLCLALFAALACAEPANSSTGCPSLIQLQRQHGFQTQTQELSRDDASNARFLMKGTFGPTSAEVLALRRGDDEFATGAAWEMWIQEQVAIPLQTHRAFYRRQVN